MTIIQPGAPGEPNRTLTPEEAAAIERPGHTEVDVAFVRDMLVHHDQALLMTSYVEERTESEDIGLLALRMQISQEGELEQLQAWLHDRGEPIHVDGGHQHSNEAMAGMLTTEQLAELEAARDEEFDELFLRYMIQHHRGALTMVHELYEAGGGLETDLDILAGHIEADQSIEISRMEQMLADRTE